MLALMAAVNHQLTRHRWNHSYKEQIIHKAYDFPLDQVVEGCQQEQAPAEPTRDIEREPPSHPIVCALYPDHPFPMQGPVDKRQRVFTTFTHKDPAIGGQR